VRVGTNHNMPNALIHHRPTNELQAKFSMEFCMAILLLEGRAGLNEFTDEVVLRPDVKEMIEKIDFVVDKEAEAAGYHKMTTLIDIELASGRKVSGRADFGKGSPAMPMTYNEVADKFRENAEFAKFPKQRAEDIVAMVRELESLPSIASLTNALAHERA
jgi:2-methylcitrate dehydratase PrpD